MPPILLVFVLVLLVLDSSQENEPLSTLDRQEISAQLARAFPADTLLWAEAPGLAAFLDQGIDHPLLEAFEDSALGVRALRDEEGDRLTLEQLLRYARHELGFDPLRVMARATRHGVALGVTLEEGEFRWAAVSHAASPAVAGRLSKRIAEHLENGTAVTTVDAFLVLGSSESMVEAAKERLLSSSGPSSSATLADTERFERLASEATNPALLRLAVDLNRLESIAGQQGEEEVWSQLRALSSEAGAHLILGTPWTQRLASASFGLAELHVEGEELHVQMILDHELQGLAPETGSLRLPAPSSNDVLHGVLHRDLEQFFAERDQFFDAEELAGFTEFIDNTALLLGGADFERDLLPSVSKSMGVIARPVNYASGAEPEIPLPGLALIFSLEDPDRLGPHLSSAFQSAVSLASIERAQEGQAPLLLGLELVEGVAMTTARFLPPYDGEVVDVRFNLEPACARDGELFLLGTHAEVVRSVLEDLRSRSKKHELSAGETTLRLNGPTLAETFERNLETLVMNQVLDEGVPMEVAQHEMEMALAFLRSLEELVLSTENLEPRGDFGRSKIELSLELCAQ